MKSFNRPTGKRLQYPWQTPEFANQTNRWVDYAVHMLLLWVLQHLGSTGAYGKILSLDFSWVFNTVIPEVLYFNSFSSPHLSIGLSWWKNFPLDWLRVPQMLGMQLLPMIPSKSPVWSWDSNVLGFLGIGGILSSREIICVLDHTSVVLSLSWQLYLDWKQQVSLGKLPTTVEQ